VIQIIVLAPTPVARAGLRALLAEDTGGDLQVIGEVADSAELSERLAGLRPDCLLLDPAPDDAALSGRLRQLLTDRPGLPIVWLIGGDEEASREALQLGVRALLRPAATAAELVVALRAAVLGLTVLDPMPTGPLLDRLTGQQARLLQPEPPSLTPRELAVLQLLAQGQTNRGIALQLGISEHTAKFHVSAVLSKLGAASRAEAVALAARLGYILI
jgi:DNA-binding NarL/FixJ family response regulator